jgi:hypothetical protein
MNQHRRRERVQRCAWALEAMPSNTELPFLRNDYNKPFVSANAFGKKFATAVVERDGERHLHIRREVPAAFAQMDERISLDPFDLHDADDTIAKRYLAVHHAHRFAVVVARYMRQAPVIARKHDGVVRRLRSGGHRQRNCCRC